MRIFDVLDEIEELRPERNELIHGLWSSSPERSTIVQTTRLERADVIHERVVTAPDLDHLCDLAIELSIELRSILRDMQSPAI